MLARSDPDGWNADGICDLSRNIRDYDLEHYGERTGFFHRPRVGDERLGL